MKDTRVLTRIPDGPTDLLTPSEQTRTQPLVLTPRLPQDTHLGGSSGTFTLGLDRRWDTPS